MRISKPQAKNYPDTIRKATVTETDIYDPLSSMPNEKNALSSQ